MSRADKQVNFRMPVELHAALVNAAQANQRSVTAELTVRLYGTFAKFIARDMTPTTQLTADDAADGLETSNRG